MVRKYTIECYQKIDGAEVPIPDEGIVLRTNERYDSTIYVRCDGVDDTNSFNLSYHGDDDFVVNRNRCELDVYIKPNLDPHEKTFYITCTHSQDSEVSVTIEITQPADTYKIDIDNTILNLPLEYVNNEDNEDIITIDQYDSLEEDEKEKYTKRYTLTLNKQINSTFNEKLSKDANYNYYEEKTLKILIQGGNEKYRIKKLNKYIIDDDQIFKKKFDNGFVYTLFPQEFIIRNYGKPFMENGYYELVLCNDYAKEYNVMLKIIYNEGLTTPRRQVTNKKTANNKIIAVSEKSYPTVNELRRVNSSIQNVEVDAKIYTYDIVFDENFNNEIVVFGKNTIDEITFKVFENNIESNLMVKSYSSARWCDLHFDTTNRKLQIRINDKPICKRKSFIKLSIATYPEIYKTFIVINKPS